ncbi:putative DNA helicase protein [Neofusicoccum parvum]|uniref:DNA helicase protein n=1 Tax=Neofusicoccum parvum TaxID=310453 RepID=A0ACB5SCE6_9PEZI|nr:putative DNA helicase protein [Neofusicoccum parvum]
MAKFRGMVHGLLNDSRQLLLQELLFSGHSHKKEHREMDPARGPEILSIRHSNTAKGGHRNIFVEDGLVVFVTRYHKGYAMSGDVKVIHRDVAIGISRRFMRGSSAFRVDEEGGENGNEQEQQ